MGSLSRRVAARGAASREQYRNRSNGADPGQNRLGDESKWSPNLVPVQFVSVTTGVAANLPVGTVLYLAKSPAGLNSTCTLTSALGGAKDRESDPMLFCGYWRAFKAHLAAALRQTIDSGPKQRSIPTAQRWQWRGLTSIRCGLGLALSMSCRFTAGRARLACLRWRKSLRFKPQSTCCVRSA